eukprot:7558625-Karenia_brevis.AAC.1
MQSWCCFFAFKVVHSINPDVIALAVASASILVSRLCWQVNPEFQPASILSFNQHESECQAASIQM